MRNPKGISKISDVINESLKIGIGNPEAASIGKLTKEVLTRHNLWEAFEPTVLFPAVNEIANAVKLSTIDGGIIWDAVAAQYPDMDFVSIPEFNVERKAVTVAILTKTKQPKAALQFCRYLTAEKTGMPIFEKKWIRTGSTVKRRRRND